jgi:AcrR family transcriptional regulator
MAAVNRKIRAQQTRDRIAAAAARLFAERGYQGTPMDAVATEAGVAVQTVYYAFRTKPELLLAAYDQAVKGGLDALTPDEQDWHRRALDEAEDNPAQAVGHFVGGVTAILGRTAALVPVMVTSPDEDVRHAFQDRQRWRYDGYRQLIEALARHGRLRPDLDERRATDLLYAVLSPEMHGILCAFCGWAPEEFTEWALTTLHSQLLDPHALSGPSRGGLRARRRSPPPAPPA